MERSQRANDASCSMGHETAPRPWVAPAVLACWVLVCAVARLHWVAVQSHWAQGTLRLEIRPHTTTAPALRNNLGASDDEQTLRLTRSAPGELHPEEDRQHLNLHEDDNKDDNTAEEDWWYRPPFIPAPVGEPCDGGRTYVDGGDIFQPEYDNDQDCTWTLTCSDPSLVPQITFTDFHTEGSWDFVYVYDGADISDRIAVTLHGNLGANVEQITGSTSTVLLRLVTDRLVTYMAGSVLALGFTGSYTCEDAVPAGPPDPCTGDPVIGPDDAALQDQEELEATGFDPDGLELKAMAFHQDELELEFANAQKGHDGINVDEGPVVSRADPHPPPPRRFFAEPIRLPPSVIDMNAKVDDIETIYYDDRFNNLFEIAKKSVVTASEFHAAPLQPMPTQRPPTSLQHETTHPKQYWWGTPIDPNAPALAIAAASCFWVAFGIVTLALGFMTGWCLSTLREWCKHRRNNNHLPAAETTESTLEQPLGAAEGNNMILDMV